MISPSDTALLYQRKKKINMKSRPNMGFEYVPHLDFNVNYTTLTTRQVTLKFFTMVVIFMKKSKALSKFR